MPGKAPKKEPVENGGYPGDDIKPKGKKTVEKPDEEMTVVVPPSKAPKHVPSPSPNQSSDNDGDVAMDDSDKVEEGGEVKADPVVQTINGMRHPFAASFFFFSLLFFSFFFYFLFFSFSLVMFLYFCILFFLLSFLFSFLFLLFF